RRYASPVAAERVLERLPMAYWLMPHDIDMMLWITASPVQKVMAYGRGGGTTRADFIIAVLTFANGAVGIVESSWGTPGGGRLQNELFTVRGTGGAVEVVGNETGIAVYRGSGDSNHMEYPDIGYAPIIH